MCPYMNQSSPWTCVLIHQLRTSDCAAVPTATLITYLTIDSSVLAQSRNLNRTVSLCIHIWTRRLHRLFVLAWCAAVALVRPLHVCGRYKSSICPAASSSSCAGISCQGGVGRVGARAGGWVGGRVCTSACVTNSPAHARSDYYSVYY